MTGGNDENKHRQQASIKLAREVTRHVNQARMTEMFEFSVAIVMLLRSNDL